MLQKKDQVVSVDEVIDYKKDNEQMFEEKIDYLKNTIKVLNAMRGAVMTADERIQKLVVEINDCSDLQKDHVDKYNSIICQMITNLRTLQSMKNKNINGRGTPFIRNNLNNKNGTITTYTMSFKRPGYAWVRNEPIAYVENMDVDVCLANNNTAIDKTIKINIGGDVLYLYSISVPKSIGSIAETYTSFMNYLNNDISQVFKLNNEEQKDIIEDANKINSFPETIQDILAHFEKNIRIITYAINDMDKLINEYKLYDQKETNHKITD